MFSRLFSDHDFDFGVGGVDDCVECNRKTFPQVTFRSWKAKMNYQDLVRDFAYRTRVNLNTLRELQKAKSKSEVYEVTQLINSMLGLLIFPQQRFVESIPQKSLRELDGEGWPIPVVEGSYPQVDNLRELVRYLRNGVAHCNLEFLSDGNGEIVGLRIWNTRKGKRTWVAKLSITDIEKITEKFIELLV